jgi:hypothetical protein
MFFFLLLSVSAFYSKLYILIWSIL